MNLSDITSRISFFTGATGGASGQFTNADRLIGINVAYQDVHSSILESHDEIQFDDKNNTSDFPILTADLKADQQDYALPTTAAKINRLELTYDGTNWKRAIPLDINELSNPTDASTIANNFTTDAPYYDLISNSMFLYPIPSVDSDDGAKIWIDRFITEFTSSDLTTGTAEPGFDMQFHDLIPLKVSYDWVLAKTKDRGKGDRLKQNIKELEDALRNYYGRKTTDRQMEMGGNVGVNDFT